MTSPRRAIRLLKHEIGRAAETCWSLAATVAPRVVRPTTRRGQFWSSPGGQCALVLAPHPDDEVAGCVGTILRHVESQDSVAIVMVTDGRQSKVMVDADRMALTRKHEAEHAARLMGVDRLEWFGLREGEWAVGDLVPRLVELVQEVRPALVYAPSRVDFHPEHFAVAHALALALARLPTALNRPTIRVYPVQVPLTSLLSNLWVDTSVVAPRCEAIWGAYPSQSRSLACTRRMRRYVAFFVGNGKSTEEFWEMSADRYIALHREPPSHWPITFRGLRSHAIGDPLSYLLGTTERLRIRRVASDRGAR